MQSCDLPRIVRTRNVVTKKDNVEKKIYLINKIKYKLNNYGCS